MRQNHCRFVLKQRQQSAVCTTGHLNTSSPWSVLVFILQHSSFQMFASCLPPFTGNAGKSRWGSFGDMGSCGLCPNPSRAGVTALSYTTLAVGDLTRRCSGCGAEVRQDERGVPERSSAVELHFLLWFGESVVREADKCTKEGRILHCVCTNCRERERESEGKEENALRLSYRGMCEWVLYFIIELIFGNLLFFNIT